MSEKIPIPQRKRVYREAMEGGKVIGRHIERVKRAREETSDLTLFGKAVLWGVELLNRRGQRKIERIKRSIGAAADKEGNRLAQEFDLLEEERNRALDTLCQYLTAHYSLEADEKEAQLAEAFHLRKTDASLEELFTEYEKAEQALIDFQNEHAVTWLDEEEEEEWARKQVVEGLAGAIVDFGETISPEGGLGILTNLEREYATLKATAAASGNFRKMVQPSAGIISADNEAQTAFTRFKQKHPEVVNVMEEKMALKEAREAVPHYLFQKRRLAQNQESLALDQEELRLALEDQADEKELKRLREKINRLNEIIRDHTLRLREDTIKYPRIEEEAKKKEEEGTEEGEESDKKTPEEQERERYLERLRNLKRSEAAVREFRTRYYEDDGSFKPRKTFEEEALKSLNKTDEQVEGEFLSLRKYQERHARELQAYINLHPGVAEKALATLRSQYQELQDAVNRVQGLYTREARDMLTSLDAKLRGASPQRKEKEQSMAEQIKRTDEVRASQIEDIYREFVHKNHLLLADVDPHMSTIAEFISLKRILERAWQGIQNGQEAQEMLDEKGNIKESVWEKYPDLRDSPGFIRQVRINVRSLELNQKHAAEYTEKLNIYYREHTDILKDFYNPAASQDRSIS